MNKISLFDIALWIMYNVIWHFVKRNNKNRDIYYDTLVHIHAIQYKHNLPYDYFVKRYI
jgi:hypothetical protein